MSCRKTLLNKTGTEIAAVYEKYGKDKKLNKGQRGEAAE